jgi:transposase
MPVPWITLGSLVLGNLDAIMKVVRPVFTRKKPGENIDRNALLDQQVAELQAAVASNAEQIRDLAAQLKEVVSALAQSAAEAAAERAERRRLVGFAVVLSGLATLGSVFAVWMATGVG